MLLNPCLILRFYGITAVDAAIGAEGPCKTAVRAELVRPRFLMVGYVLVESYRPTNDDGMGLRAPVF